MWKQDGTKEKKYKNTALYAAYTVDTVDMVFIVSSVRSSYSHPDLLLIHHPTFSDHTGPQHWTFTF